MKTVTKTRPSWQVMVAAIAAIGVGFGFGRYGYGLFLPGIRAEFGLSVGALGVIGSGTYVGYLGALTAVGGLIGRFGPRPLIVTGGLAAAAGMGLAALAPNPAVLVAGLVLAGTSSGWLWAPYSDAVRLAVAAPDRERVLGAVPSGTAFAVTVAGPLALLVTSTGWRTAFGAFAVLAVAATAYNALLLPPGTVGQPDRRRAGPRWFARAEAVPLYLTALSYGVLGSVHWTYAVDAISSAAGGDALAAPLFWTLTGVAGTAAVGTPRLIVRLGLRGTHRTLQFALAVSVGLIGVAPGSLALAGVSAVVYGSAYMALSGLLAVWSYQVFPDRPSTGFTAAVFFLGIGSVAGPLVFGLLAEAHGFAVVFLAVAAIAALTMGVPPQLSVPDSPTPVPTRTR